MVTKVDDLVNRIRELSGDCEIQRFEIIGLRDDLATRDERIAELEARLESASVLKERVEVVPLKKRAVSG